MKKHQRFRPQPINFFPFFLVIISLFSAFLTFSLYSVFVFGSGPLSLFSNPADINIVRGGGGGRPATQAIRTQDVSPAANNPPPAERPTATEKKEERTTPSSATNNASNSNTSNTSGSSGSGGGSRTGQRSGDGIVTTTETITSTSRDEDLEGHGANVHNTVVKTTTTNANNNTIISTTNDITSTRVDKDSKPVDDNTITVSRTLVFKPGTKAPSDGDVSDLVRSGAVISTTISQVTKDENGNVIDRKSQAFAPGQTPVLLTNPSPSTVQPPIQPTKPCEGAFSLIGPGQMAQTGRNATSLGGSEDQRECTKCGGGGDGLWGGSYICGEGEATNYITRPDEVLEDESKKAACWSNGAWYADTVSVVGDKRCVDGSWLDPTGMQKHCGDAGYNTQTGFCNEADFAYSEGKPEPSISRSNQKQVLPSPKASARVYSNFLFGNNPDQSSPTDTPWYQFYNAPDSNLNVKESIGTLGGAVTGLIGSTIPCFAAGPIGYLPCRAAATIGGAYLGNKAVDYTSPSNASSQSSKSGGLTTSSKVNSSVPSTTRSSGLNLSNDPNASGARNNQLSSNSGTDQNGINTPTQDFIYYSQLDPAWKNSSGMCIDNKGVERGINTFGQIGCGLTVDAMLISNYTDDKLNPIETKDKYFSYEGYNCGSYYSDHEIVLENVYGFDITDVSHDVGSDPAAYLAAKASPDNPYVVGFHYQGAPAGHYALVIGTDGEGNPLTLDPYEGAYKSLTVENYPSLDFTNADIFSVIPPGQ